MVDALEHRINAGELQLYCVDSIDGEALYSEQIPPPERIQRHLRYEAYIRDEVLPFSAVKNPNSKLIAHGCSLGAYHAMNIALRHPGMFHKVVALSGRYDLTQQLGPYRALFDGFYNDQIYFNNPSHFLPQIQDEAILRQLRRMEIIFVIGQEDAFLRNNQELSQRMTEKKIPHEFYIWEGEAHRPRIWREMVRCYL